jgi:hypothetical protein
MSDLDFLAYAQEWTEMVAFPQQTLEIDVSLLWH